MYIHCRFSCGRWFARSEDDGSVERLLVAERVPQTIAKSGTMSALSELWMMLCLHALTILLAISCHLSDVDSILPSSPSRRRASTRREHEESEQAHCVFASIIMHVHHRIFLMTSETDMDVKLELKTVMDKIRTLSMGKNKETTVSWVLILTLLFCTVMEYAVYLL